ncbi:hypothetical protein CASFOL_009932 [Castilleja foliolosa]|uniref:Pectinesterase inhibitor domain-containing protein n=1 Tax=Castilleja foliolosa TaxID=1961234 RepID=A0ABD3DT00_9LAMI
MLCKLFFLSAVLLGLSLSASAEQPLPRLKLRYGNKVSTLSGEPLIETACRGVGEFESECISTLQSAPSDQKANANGLTFFTLRFVMDHAVNLTVDIKKLQISELSPLLQSALNDCLDQYNPLDDLIEDATNSVLTNSYSEARKFIDAAMTDIDECDSSLKASNMEEKLENKTGDDVQLAKNLKEYNVFLKNILSAASNILKAN